jgi:hypothetical protein
MDISGETQRDITHNILKVRVDERGIPIPKSHTAELRGQADLLNDQKQADYCGSCYGGQLPESGCCNTCDEVRESYLHRGWSFGNPDAIEQVGVMQLPSTICIKSMTSSARVKVGRRNCRNNRMKAVMSPDASVSTKSLVTSISPLGGHSRQHPVITMSWCPTSAMMATLTTSAISSTSSHLKGTTNTILEKHG